MFQLSEQQAQEIVDKMMADIPYNINIMNEQGIIIGSGERHRVGTIHQGAVEALSIGKMIEIRTAREYEKQGTNEPIVINQQYVGVIGITGHPDEVRPFCNIVRTTVTLLIEQRIAFEKQTYENNRKKAFSDLLLHYTGTYSQKIKKEATSYHIDLLVKTTVLYIKSFQRQEDQPSNWLPYPWFEIDEDSYVVLIQDPANISPCISTLYSHHPEQWIAVGTSHANIATSYQQARSAMTLLLSLRPSTQIIHYDEVAFIAQWSHTELMQTGNSVTKLEGYSDLLDTLRSFIEHNCNMSDTAIHLNIHRNTLQYRLKKIQQVTGKDPRQLLHLIELTYGLISLYK